MTGSLATSSGGSTARDNGHLNAEWADTGRGAVGVPCPSGTDEYLATLPGSFC